jgi:ABC-2 type transport system permease protein
MVAETLAFVRQDFLTQTSYKIRTVFALVSIVVTIVPVYFVAHALQPLMAESIRGQGGEYFGFLIVGLAAQRIMNAAVTVFPQNTNAGIRTGTLEALFATPVALPTLVTGMISYRILWSLAEAGTILVAGILMGADFAFARVPAAMLIVALIILTYVPFGILGASAVLMFRTTGPLTTVVTLSSILLGGVYYPTKVIPTWIESFSAVIPLTYGLRALRKTALDGAGLGAVAGDVLILAAFAAGLIGVSILVFQQALRFARRSGSLGHY